jgi:predicted anti-sigma-YlaC factor YlaD
MLAHMDTTALTAAVTTIWTGLSYLPAVVLGTLALIMALKTRAAFRD